MASSHDGTCLRNLLQGLVARTSPLMSAKLYKEYCKKLHANHLSLASVNKINALETMQDIFNRAAMDGQSAVHNLPMVYFLLVLSVIRPRPLLSGHGPDFKSCNL